jgi:acetolactate synthase-1/2/3 large subunit
MRVADYILDAIACRGVEDIFFLPGGGAMHLNNALLRNKCLQAVSMLHEQGASIASEAYARTSGLFGVCMVTSGPGATNAITGVSGAWFESTPMVVISGQVKRADLKGGTQLRQLGTQELDIVTVVSSITKYAVCLTDPALVRYEVEKALFLMQSGRPGPVWIDVPMDIQASEINPESLIGYELAHTEQVQEACLTNAPVMTAATQVANMLMNAKRPVMLLGNGVHCACAAESARALVDQLQVPTQTTWIGADLLECSHPLYFGRPGTVASRGANFTIQNADLVIAIGCRMDYSITGYNRNQFARGAAVVVVDIDEAEIDKLGDLPKLRVVADAGVFINQLSDAMSTRPKPKYGEWIALCNHWKECYPVVVPENYEQSGYPNTYVFTQILCDELESSDMLIPGSSGASIDTFWLSAELKKGQRAVATGGLGAMGYGLPAAIGGCIGSNGRRTISVDGDGGFMLNIQELEVVRRLNLPIKFFVLNNNGYASIRASQTGYFKEAIGCDSDSGLTLPDICKVASAFGVQSLRIDNQQDLRSSIREALNYEGPVICEVMVQPDQTIGPRVSSRLGKDGAMVSTPLEDLSPFLDREELRGNMLIPLMEE